ncbi:hypothetical protein [Streptomyces sp. NPDC096030]|uniref:hypothetical protein n=1 Tax=Streptomyces sp. NPDC096030 TaxID=3155423 RepID=UPI00332CB4C2
MRDRTGRWIRIVMLAAVSVSCAALLVGCDSDEDDPADEPSPSVVTTDGSVDPLEDRSEDPDGTPNPQPTGADDQSIAPPPPPPTATGEDEDDGPDSAPETPTLPPDGPSPKAPVTPRPPAPPELPDPDGT